MWELYDDLIEGIPTGIKVADYAAGISWSYVRTPGSLGLAATVRNFERPPLHRGSVNGAELKDIAALAKSWNLVEASLGVAAMNCWYNSPQRMQKLGRLPRTLHALSPMARPGSSQDKEAFGKAASLLAGKKVAVIGHFPHIEKQLGGICELSVLERCPSKGDLPDSACEYVLPGQDFVFITGMTLANKTLERLLKAAEGARITLVGPSTPMCERIFRHGASELSGFTVTEQDAAADFIRRGTVHPIFHHGFMVSMSAEDMQSKERM